MRVGRLSGIQKTQPSQGDYFRSLLDTITNEAGIRSLIPIPGQQASTPHFTSLRSLLKRSRYQKKITIKIKSGDGLSRTTINMFNSQNESSEFAPVKLQVGEKVLLDFGVEPISAMVRAIKLSSHHVFYDLDLWVKNNNEGAEKVHTKVYNVESRFVRIFE